MRTRGLQCWAGSQGTQPLPPLKRLLPHASGPFSSVSSHVNSSPPYKSEQQAWRQSGRTSGLSLQAPPPRGQGHPAPLGASVRVQWGMEPSSTSAVRVLVISLPWRCSCCQLWPQVPCRRLVPLGTRETPTQTRMCANSTWDPKKSTVRTTCGHRENSRAGRRRGAALDRRTCFLDTPVPILSALRRSQPKVTSQGLSTTARPWAARSPRLWAGHPRAFPGEQRPVRHPAEQGEQGGFESGSWLLK